MSRQYDELNTPEKRQYFTPHELETLRYLGAFGQSAAEIGKVLGKTVAQIHRAARAHQVLLGLDKRPWTGPQIEKARELASLGISNAMAARIMNRPPLGLDYVHHHFGIKVAERPCKINTSVTRECYDRLSESGYDASRTAGAVLECATRRPDLLPVVMPPPVNGAPISTLVTVSLQARA
jgi:hypothetical protein